jgi:phenylacetate-CoA ligase
MSPLLMAKRRLGRLPYPLGWAAAQLPFAMRPGIAGIYNRRRREIASVARLSLAEQKAFVFARMQPIAAWAYRHVPFYADLYLSTGVDPTRFRHFDELASLPIVTKQMLQAVPLEHRSAHVSSRSLENTGGSSGQPLDFYVEPSSIPHEWAHMHKIWERVGYRSRHLKLLFAGRSTIKNVLEYDSLRHHFAVDIYAGWQAVADKLMKLPFLSRPRFLHGYPSAIFDFVQWLESEGHPLLARLRGEIEGLLLGSEYPSPDPRARTEKLLGCPSVSWYGHTERAVLAFEDGAKSVYRPFLSYGFVEAVPGANGQRLIGSTYYNHASPFIRYDTGDIVEADVEDGLVRRFRISQGRSGDFILDSLGNKIFLTGLIFGRHHKIFDYCRYIQVGQELPGFATIYVVPKGDAPSDWGALFDGSNVHLDFEFKAVTTPLRTPAGKVPLLVKKPVQETTAT